MILPSTIMYNGRTVFRPYMIGISCLTAEIQLLQLLRKETLNNLTYPNLFRIPKLSIWEFKYSLWYRYKHKVMNQLNLMRVLMNSHPFLQILYSKIFRNMQLNVIQSKSKRKKRQMKLFMKIQSLHLLNIIIESIFFLHLSPQILLIKNLNFQLPHWKDYQQWKGHWNLNN